MVIMVDCSDDFLVVLSCTQNWVLTALRVVVWVVTVLQWLKLLTRALCIQLMQACIGLIVHVRHLVVLTTHGDRISVVIILLVGGFGLFTKLRL